MNVFVSYRREDSAAHAGRLYDRLSAHFGAEHVFRDIDDIRPGQDFARVLEDTAGRADALVALIGPKWLSARLADPADFVRREIEMALERRIPVFPVLVSGASMPGAAGLPQTLRALASRQALELTDARYHEDTGRLIDALEGGRQFRNRKAIVRMLLAAASLVIATFGAWMYQQGQPARSEPVAVRKLQLRGGGASLSREQINAAIVRHNFYCKGVNEAGGAAGPLERRVIGETAVVADAATGLMWQQGGSRRPTDYAGAGAVAAAANSARLAGFEDWRLPTAEEAMSLMAPKPSGGFYLSPLFDRMAAPFIWTSDRQSDERGWVIYFKDGIAATEPFTFHAPVRLVRTMK